MSPPTVSRIELWHFGAPLPEPFLPAWIPGYPQAENRCTLVRIVDSDGVEGWSAGPELIRERRGLGDLVGLMLGQDATDIGLAQQRIREVGYFGWKNWWIEPAFWDMAGHRAGQPLWRLLGAAEGGEVDLYASFGEVRTGARRIADAETRLEEGFGTVKLRVHEDEAADIRQVTEVAEALGDRLRIGVDANQGWRVTAFADAPLWDLARAERFADVCADLGVAWLEEPLPMDAYDDQVALSEHSRVPISGAEIHTGGEPELRMMIERGCYSIYQPDAMFTGGIDQTTRIIALCRDKGVTYTPHTWTNGLGFAVNLHLYALSDRSTPLEYPLEEPSWVPQARDGMLTEPFVAEEGRIRIPDGPGLGVTVSAEALRDHGEQFFVAEV